MSKLQLAFFCPNCGDKTKLQRIPGRICKKCGSFFEVNIIKGSRILGLILKFPNLTLDRNPFPSIICPFCGGKNKLSAIKKGGDRGCSVCQRKFNVHYVD